MSKQKINGEGANLNKLGFSLVEVLAVLVIIVVIAFITIPLVLNAVENSRKQAFLDTAYGILKSTDLSYFKANEKEMDFPIHYQFVDSNLSNYEIPLEFKGDHPKSGDIFLYKNGEVQLSLWDGKYCVAKGRNEVEIKFVNQGESDCEIKPLFSSQNGETQYVELGGTYIPKRYEAYSIEGENITDRITSSIKKDGKKVEKVNPLVLGTYTITYSIEDEGKINSLNHTVIVRDTKAPVITLNGSSKNQSTSIEAVTTYQVPLAEVTDNSLYDNTPYHVTCGGNSIVTENGGACIGISSVNPKLPGEYEILYKAVDESGNETTLIYTVTVTPDLVPPTIEFTTDIVLTTENPTFNKTNGVVLTDNISDSKDIKLEVIGNTNFEGMAAGTYEVTYKATDEAGNSTTKKRSIKIRNTAPLLDITGSTTQYVELGSSYSAPTYEAYSLDGEDITNKVTSSIKKDGKAVTSVNPLVLGTYTVTYSITDEGKTTNVNHTVIVRDTTPPVITLNGSTKNQSTSIEAVRTYTVPVATVTDNSLYTGTPYHVTCGNNSTVTTSGGSCVGISSVTPKLPGTYEVKYTAVDESGNKATLTYTVTVTPDVVPPEIQFTTDIVLTATNPTFNKTDGVVLSDNISDAKDIELEVIGDVNFQTMDAGTHEVTYKATDEAGNSATKKRTIKIVASDYTIVFHENRATTGTTSIATKTNTNVTMPANPFAASFGFTFKEWNTKADGTGTSYAAGAVVRNLTTTANGTVNLYAIWTRPDTLYLFDGGTAAGMTFTPAPGGATATVGSTLYLKSSWYKFPSITSSVIDVTGYSKFHIYVSSASAPWKGGSGNQARSTAGATFAGKTLFYIEKTSTSGEKVVDISDITSGTFVLSASSNGDSDGWTNAQSSTVTVTKIWLTK